MTKFSSDFPVSRNRQLKALLRSLEEDLHNARNTEDLVAMVEKAKAFGTPLKFNNRIPYQMAAIFLVLAGAVFFFLHSLDLNPVWALLPLPGAVFFGLWGFLRNTKSHRISADMFKHDILFDNQLVALSQDLAQQTRSLAEAFQEFRRGDHAREIKEMLQGNFSGTEHSFTYTYYHFHYVDKRQSGIGSKRTTTYEHYDRYGLLVQFNFARNLSIQSFQRSKKRTSTFRAASNYFNKLYSVKAESEMDAAKFLKPKIVVALEDIHQHFHRPNFEFSSSGELCMSFQNSGLIQIQPTHDLNAPDPFIEELRHFNELTDLKIALEHIHTLMKYSDSNFQTP